MKSLAALLLIALLITALPACARVAFDSNGVAQVNGVPFFPIGVYLYDLNTDVLAEVHSQEFNVHVYQWGKTPVAPVVKF